MFQQNFIYNRLKNRCDPQSILCGPILYYLPLKRTCQFIIGVVINQSQDIETFNFILRFLPK